MAVLLLFCFFFTTTEFVLCFWFSCSQSGRLLLLLLLLYKTFCTLGWKLFCSFQAWFVERKICIFDIVFVCVGASSLVLFAVFVAIYCYLCTVLVVFKLSSSIIHRLRINVLRCIWLGCLLQVKKREREKQEVRERSDNNIQIRNGKVKTPPKHMCVCVCVCTQCCKALLLLL